MADLQAHHDHVVVDYYSDILCVWAWIAQRRIEELDEQWGKRVQLHYHCMDVFGDVPGKMAKQWQARGGYAGFAEHVKHSVQPFDHITLHADLWHKTRPQSSFPAHLLIKAVALVAGESVSAQYALQLRRAFFEQAIDIGRKDLLLAEAEPLGVATAAIQAQLDSGRAYAALMADYQKAKAEGLKGSPSYILDGGRQVLFGNVGYRVLAANVEELLRNPGDEASWC